MDAIPYVLIIGDDASLESLSTSPGLEHSYDARVKLLCKSYQLLSMLTTVMENQLLIGYHGWFFLVRRFHPLHLHLLHFFQVPADDGEPMKLHPLYSFAPTDSMAN